ncbi:MAG: preprotein translocase subunit SecY [Candidatus Sumerlaeota bacterium]|nr:preprotein translocase subunit SecY [Candidatus Sumerlaeota bacterium]
MFQAITNLFKIPDLRKKIAYTLMMVGVFRIGQHIPSPFVDGDRLKELFEQSFGSQGVFNMVNMFTGGGFSKMSVMALGIMPYISAQIILQLLMVVWPWLEKLKKEGEAGQRKIEQYSRYGTIVLAIVQSLGLGIWMKQNNLIMPALSEATFLGFIPGTWVFLLIAMLSITTGTALLMWIGERITEKGVGNGISLIIALGIVSAYPGGIALLVSHLKFGSVAKIWVPILAALCIFTTVMIILIQEGARKIPIQHARRTVGRRVQTAQTNYLPLKVNTAGVIPVIFSSAILTLPQTVFGWVGGGGGGFMQGLGIWFSPNTPYNLYDILNIQKESIFLLLKMVNLYTLAYIVLTGFFCFFYTAVTFNPQDVADNLKKSGAFIPGYRPGKQTADYIDMVLTRITTVGAVFLVAVALIPMVLSMAFKVNYAYAEFAGGTGLIIVVGVVLDTMKRVESQMLMRHYDGFKIRRQTGGGGGSGRWSGRK